MKGLVPIERLPETIVVRAGRHPRATLGLVAAATLLLGAGLPQLRFGTGLLDFLPAGDSHVQAFRDVVREVDGITNQELVWAELDPEKARAVGVQSITDERSIRAQDELIGYVLERVPEVELTFGLPDWIKLVRHAARGGEEPGSYALPASSMEFALIFQALSSTQGDMLAATLSRDGQAALIGFVVEGDPLADASRATGRKIRDALAAYAEETALEFDLFREETLLPIGLASGMDRLDERLREDCARLAPWAGLLIAVVLFLGFRAWLPVLGTFLHLALGLIWVFGVMGWLSIRLNLVNIALLPLLLGNGINHSIHLFNEFGARRHRGSSPEDALAFAGREAGFALLLTTAISAGSLLALAFSGVPGMVELGALAAFGLVALWLLVLLLPAAWLSLLPGAAGGRRAAPSRILAAGLSALGGRGRFGAGAVLVLLSLAVILLPSKVYYQLDVIQGNFAPSDPVSRTVERIRNGVGGAFPEFLIVEGDVTDPAVLRYCAELEARVLSEDGGLGPSTRILGPGRVLGSYAILKDGAGPALGRFLAARGRLADAAPTDQAAIGSALTAMHEDRAWASLAKLCTSRDLDLAVVAVMPETRGLTLESAEEVWERLEAAIAAAETVRPAGVRASFLGYRTLTYLFIETSLRWMKVLFGVGAALACGLVLLTFPRKRAALVVALIVGLTGLWWVGLLQIFEVYVSIFLLFPMVFLIGIGTDYGLHLLWRGRQSSPEEVYGVTGKAVLISAVTDGGVFLIFVGMTVVSASQVMQAAVLATVAMVLVTGLVVPLYLGSGRSSSQRARMVATSASRPTPS